ncbi:MAG: TIGR04150 pseudo-rSAM protein [Bacteroidales bacterium]|nr:TIGR04150 pseudo-rSAM protein [Bacteroidales bacterium]
MILLNKTFFTIYPFTYYCLKGDTLFLYNTLNGERFIKSNCDKNILDIITKLYNTNNIGMVEVNPEKFNESALCFFKEIKEKLFGDIIHSINGEFNPVQIPKRIHLSGNRFSEEILFPDKSKGFTQIKELHFFIMSKYKFVPGNNSLYRQFLTNCNFKDCNQDLKFEKFRDLVEELMSYELSIVTLYCDDIFLYREYEKLFAFLNNLNIKIELVFSYEYYVEKYSQIKKSILNPNIRIILHHYNLKELEKDFCTEVGLNCFFVESEQQFNLVEENISEIGIDNYHIAGIYNGNNDSFFESAVFIELEDIFEEKIDFQSILVNSEMNRNDFGKLIILSNGNVFANINNALIGNYYTESLDKILEEELKNGSSWGNVRQRVAPCSECVYNCLCPPISNYEYVLGKFNLCKIFK